MAAVPAQAHLIFLVPLQHIIWWPGFIVPFVFAVRADLFGIQPGDAIAPIATPIAPADTTPIVDEIGLSVGWDPDVLRWNYGGTIGEWDSDLSRILVDNTAGLANIFLESRAGITSEQFQVVNIGLIAHGVGVSPITIDTTSGYCSTGEWGPCGVFLDGVEIPVDLVGGTVIVRSEDTEPPDSGDNWVPVPDTIWLLATGLVALPGIRFARSAYLSKSGARKG